MKKSLEELTEIAINAAKLAGGVIQSATEDQRQAQRKAGGSSLASQVVTEVDLASQRVILEALDDGEFGLLTEESSDDSSRFQRDYFWCIDPLDGTLPFVEGKPGYSVSIALVSRAGESQLGVIFDPETETLYHAYRGGGFFRNGKRWTLETSDTLTLVMDRSMPKHERYSKFLAMLESKGEVRIIDHGGASLNACWVLENAPALYVKFPKTEPGGGSIWDFAASACLFTEADCVVSDIHGHPLQLNRPKTTFMNEDGVLFASDATLAQCVIELIASLSLLRLPKYFSTKTN